MALQKYIQKKLNGKKYHIIIHTGIMINMEEHNERSLDFIAQNAIAYT